jgi:hypothetical protein
VRGEIFLCLEGLPLRRGDDFSVNQFVDGKEFSLSIDLLWPEKTIQTSPQVPSSLILFD